MKIADIDLDKDVMVVAEIGNNHEGSYALAEEMIGQAAEAGAHAVKFQTIRPEYLVSFDAADRLARLRKFAFTYEQFAALAKLAKESGVIFMSTPFDLESADAIKNLSPAIKIASGDNTFLPLIERVASFGMPIVMSCGLADIEELSRPVELIQNRWRAVNAPNALVLLHCVASYPAPPREANLSAIRELAKAFDCTIGYSDHTLGIDAAFLSVGYGARLIEKHFTIDKNYSDFRDHQLSADPADLRELVQKVKLANEMNGQGTKDTQPSEAANAIALRRSIAAGAELPAGTVLRFEHLTWVRPGGGFAPGDESAVLGCVLKRHYRLGEILIAEDLTTASGS